MLRESMVISFYGKSLLWLRFGFRVFCGAGKKKAIEKQLEPGCGLRAPVHESALLSPNARRGRNQNCSR
jgi:hypothetical protein